MILDSENDRKMLLAIMQEANIKGASAVPFALLMERVARAVIAPPAQPIPADKPALDAANEGAQDPAPRARPKK